MLSILPVATKSPVGHRGTENPMLVFGREDGIQSMFSPQETCARVRAICSEPKCHAKSARQLTCNISQES